MRLIHFIRGCVIGVVLLLGMSVRLTATPSPIGAPLGSALPSAGAAERPEPKRSYHLPRGDATTMLRQFATISESQVLFMMEKVQGVQTNAIDGEYSPRDALKLMLAGTALYVVWDEAVGGFVVSRQPSAEQLAEVGRDRSRSAAIPQNSPTPKNEVTMKIHKTLFDWLKVLVVSAGLTNLPAGAQTVPAPQPAAPASTEQTPEEVVVKMSPFVVDASKDKGYVAANTLAGTRLRTDLADVGSSISVVTKELMVDLGATNNRTLLAYTVNTEVGGPRGNYSGGVKQGTYQEQDLFKDPNGNNRVRGLTNADNTRNFYLTDIPWDSYAVDRVDMLRGPNAILFGLGSPAGVINASTKEAMFKNKGSIELTFDKYGSQRVVLDYNREILPGELAARVVVMRNNQTFQQDPAFSDDRRIYAAIKYQPRALNSNGNTFTISANYENGNIQSNQPRTVTPEDNITRFWKPADQGGLDGKLLDNSKITTGWYVTGGTNNDPYYASEGGAPLGSVLNRVNSNYGYAYSVPNANYRYGSLLFNGTKVMAPFDPNGVGVRGSNNIYSVAGNRNWANLYRYGTSQVRLPFADFGGYQDYTLSDPSIFDFYHKLIDGPNKHEWSDWNALNADLSATFLNGDVGIDLSGFQQKFNNGQWGALGWGDEPIAINIDPNMYTADGQTNPDAGRAYVTAENRDAGNNTGVSIRRSYRAQLFAKHDFSKSMGLFGRILGEHDFQAVFSSEKQRTDNRAMRSEDISPADGNLLYPGYYPTTGTAYPAGGYLESSSAYSIGTVYYLGGNLMTSTSAAGINASNMTQPFFMGKDGPITVRRFDATWNAPATVNPGAFWQNPYDPVTVDAAGNPTGPTQNGNTSSYGGPGYYTQSWNPANYVGWVQTPMTLVTMNSNTTVNGVSARDYLTVSAQKTEYDVNSKIFTWQGFLWDRAIVGMFGYRDDRAYSYELQAAPRANTGTGDEIPAYTGITPYSYGSANVSPGFYNYSNPLGTVVRQEVYSHNWSVVAHLNKFLGKEHDFLPINISLAYNRGMNYQPAAGRIDAFAHALPDPAGKTNEQSLLLATKDNKYSLRLTHYDTKVTNGSSTGQINNMWALEQVMGFTATMARQFRSAEESTGNYLTAGPYIDYGNAAGGGAAGQAAEQKLHDVVFPAWYQFEKDVLTKYPAYVTAWMGKGSAWGTDSNQGVNAQAPAGFVFTEDSESKGYELELVANPTPDWRIALNASRTTAARDNVPGTAFKEIADFTDNAMENTDVGLAPVWWDGNIYGGRVVGPYSYFRPDWLLLNALNGQSDPEVRKYHANLVTNYEFSKSFLKGVGVGGAYRWEDKSAIGYAPMQVISSTTGVATEKINLNAPVYAPSQKFLDLWISYRRKLSNKVGWTLQLNVYNVGGKNKLVPFAATIDEAAIQKLYPNGLPTDQPTGYIPMKPSAFRIQDGMSWQITNTFSF